MLIYVPIVYWFLPEINVFVFVLDKLKGGITYCDGIHFQHTIMHVK